MWLHVATRSVLGGGILHKHQSVNTVKAFENGARLVHTCDISSINLAWQESYRPCQVSGHNIVKCCEKPAILIWILPKRTTHSAQHPVVGTKETQPQWWLYWLAHCMITLCDIMTPVFLVNYPTPHFNDAEALAGLAQNVCQQYQQALYVSLIWPTKTRKASARSLHTPTLHWQLTCMVRRAQIWILCMSSPSPCEYYYIAQSHWCEM